MICIGTSVRIVFIRDHTNMVKENTITTHDTQNADVHMKERTLLTQLPLCLMIRVLVPPDPLSEPGILRRKHPSKTSKKSRSLSRSLPNFPDLPEISHLLTGQFVSGVTR
jgi:hypothetical protein